MNADEIIKALRDTIENGNEHPQTSVTNQCKDCYLCEIAADAIDELQDKLFEERVTSQALRNVANGRRAQPDNVPIVRCGKCSHYNTTGYPALNTGTGWCEKIDRGVSDEFYCSYGEKMEDKPCE